MYQWKIKNEILGLGKTKNEWPSSKVERLREILYFDVAQCTVHIVGYHRSGVKILYALILVHGLWTRVTSGLLSFIGPPLATKRQWNLKTSS
jgi:hypothetical protein